MPVSGEPGSKIGAIGGPGIPKNLPALWLINLQPNNMQMRGAAVRRVGATK
jgi:hypothetical protein